MEPLARDSLLSQIGGETVLRGLVNAFYDLIETDPRGKSLLRLLFRGHGVDHAREEQFNFLCGFLGGPRHYLEKHGHMDVRLMHAHVPISAADAEDWLALMDQAIASMQLSGPPVDKMRVAFRRVALMLVNDLGEWGVRKA
ncbi:MULTISPECIES: group II truncated hemoglobin [unclassified Mesorhizobium]|uniref:group II truncated hemoglobin n=1 Tax=unclassified Mesorhizobium TaxID=325217 RepID=UPI000BB0AE52|nr:MULTISPECIES: group II truncated hemoglobin [unclassified Mesorhizobium]TGT53270.1 cyanoglobin [Mesorhizobium sp. M00.F.Ca.ET.170.01.1.1]AZO11573.1 cyanoglobin [Mesorhizobium sp. M3A.F.Ca.ET.080.04.2.1]PBB83346.1 cyanoglobin [Mesorhizobium sp. WSM3876]RWB72791.1 MAG: cyanoglobin [Mesorhizobium sp.]RWB86935.1 MAG: cyanoglobin [Mesorhizobium sp.]